MRTSYKFIPGAFMFLTSIETTPNPNSMKLNFDESFGAPVTYTGNDIVTCPDSISGLLRIIGVTSIFVCNDFITINRDPRSDWQLILDAVTKILPRKQQSASVVDERRIAAESLGKVVVQVQTFKGVPIQVKVSDNSSEKRVALAPRFSSAALLIQERSGADFLKERYWAEWGVRYGTVDEVAAEVVDEIHGTISADELEKMVQNDSQGLQTKSASRAADSRNANLSSHDWHLRLLAVQELGTDHAVIPLLMQALRDEHQQVRRMAAAALGASGSSLAVAPLCEVLLKDSSAGVRRTAGDALSDLGDISAQAAVCEALSDSNKLVRWRAARFLADVGDDRALSFLKKTANDSEFEVRLEIEAAIERIIGGKECSMPVWKKILKNTDISF